MVASSQFPGAVVTQTALNLDGEQRLAYLYGLPAGTRFTLPEGGEEYEVAATTLLTTQETVLVRDAAGKIAVTAMRADLVVAITRDAPADHAGSVPNPFLVRFLAAMLATWFTDGKPTKRQGVVLEEEARYVLARAADRLRPPVQQHGQHPTDGVS